MDGRSDMPTKDEEAMTLAQKHYEIEAGLMQIFRITGSAEVELRPLEPIMLLEVNENTVPSGIMPIQFGPSPASGLYYPSIILEVTPDEFQRIQSRRSHPKSKCSVYNLRQETPEISQKSTSNEYHTEHFT